jgi:hypothetical protein
MKIKEKLFKPTCPDSYTKFSYFNLSIKKKIKKKRIKPGKIQQIHSIRKPGKLSANTSDRMAIF